VIEWRRDTRVFETPNDHFPGVNHFFRGSSESPPHPVFGESLPPGLFDQSRLPPAGADEREEGIQAMQGLMEGAEGEECGVGTQHTLHGSSRAFEEFDSLQKANRVFQLSASFILSARRMPFQCGPKTGQWWRRQHLPLTC
jgi:hypothetical protein